VHHGVLFFLFLSETRAQLEKASSEGLATTDYRLPTATGTIFQSKIFTGKTFWLPVAVVGVLLLQFHLTDNKNIGTTDNTQTERVSVKVLCRQKHFCGHVCIQF